MSITVKKIGKYILGEKLCLILIKMQMRLKFVSKADLDKITLYSAQYPKILSTNDTVDWIIKNKGSITRYGDGEFDICFERNCSSFQNSSDKLKNRLLEILNSSNDKFMVCIPPFNSRYNNTKNCYGKLSFWEYYWLKNFNEIKKILKLKQYGNSFVSRSDVFYECDLEKVKKIWKNRKVIFVYGDNGRFEIKPELFNNIKESIEIKVSPKNAFSEYDQIMEKCLKYDKDYLFLLAIGQTATVLAFDLYKAGYQAIDIGHFPNSYDQYLGKILSPERIPIVKINKKGGTII
ncbi:MAG: GT-D fold domain-containing glycosyltransferase [Fusobacteriaceae bacterium]